MTLSPLIYIFIIIEQKSQSYSSEDMTEGVLLNVPRGDITDFLYFVTMGTNVCLSGHPLAETNIGAQTDGKIETIGSKVRSYPISCYFIVTCHVFEYSANGLITPS